MEALFRKKQLGGTSMTAQEMTPIRRDPQTLPADSTTKRIFIGPNGLRAGWRLLIFMAIVMAMSAVARMIIKRFFPDALDPAQLTSMRIIVPDLLVCFILAVAAWTMSKIEGRRLGQYGLPRSEALRKNFWIGALIGLLATSGTVLAIFALHGVRFTSAALDTPEMHGAAILTAASSLGTGIFARRFGRRIFVSRIRAVHTDDWHGILASRIFALGFIRAGSRDQWRRSRFGRSVGGFVRFVVVLVSPPNWKFMVCGRLSPGI